MLKSSSTCKFLFIAIFLSFSVITIFAANRYSVATGNWNATSTWSASSGGSSGASVPVAGDNVFIEGGRTVSVTANSACSSITYTTATASVLIINAGITLTVSGAITIPRPGGSGLNTITVGSGNLNTGSIAFTSGGGTVRHSITISTGTVTVAGNVTQTGSTGSATIAFSGAGTLNLGGTFLTVATGTLTLASGCTVNYNGAVQTAGNFTYNNLTLSGSGAKTVTGVTVNARLSIEGSATITGSAPSYGAASSINYMGSSAQTTGIELPAVFNGTGGVIINNASGLTLSSDKTISGTLTMTQGNIITGAFTLSISNALASSLIFSSGTIIGKIKRTVSTTLSTNYLFPVGTAAFHRPAVLNFSSISATTDITAEFISTAPTGFAGYTDGGTPLNNTFTEGYWRFSSSGTPTGTYSLTLTGNGFTSYSLNEVTRITGRDNSNGTWRALGIHGSQSSNDVSRTGITNLNSTSFDFALANGCGNISMGYGYERNITVDYTKVSGGADLYSFPMLVNLSGQSFLRTSPTGQIVNSNGYDIIFTDINYNKLDHQLEYYNGTNGDLIAWVRIPILSSSANTVIKIMYGNSQVTTDLSVTSVWDSHYKGVWHLNNNILNDFTSYNKSGTAYNSPTYPAGQISNALGLNGSSQYVEVLNDPNINFAGNITISAWIRMTTGGRDQKIASNQNNSSGGYKFGIFTNNKVEFEIRTSSNAASLNRDVTGGTVLGTGQWYYVAGMSSDVLDSIKTFVNGLPERPFKKTGTLGVASNNLVLSKEPFAAQYYFAGQFDEIRISNKVRSNGWLRTEYNNQFSPSTFSTVSSESISYDLLSASICNSPIALTFGYPSGGTYSGNAYISGNVFTPPADGTYPIAYTYNGGCGSFSITKNIVITPVPSAPVASNKVYCTGQIANLEATTGTNIKWYSGATQVSTANPFSTGITAPGTYSYTVTQTVNGCESPATSVTLTILTGTSIITQPQPNTTCTGSNATFSVLASGYNLVYQWQEGGVNITNGGIYSGATTATLTLTNPGTAKNGASYRCRIFSTCGTSPITSTAAILTVNASPVATFSYTGTPYCPNGSDPLPTYSGGGIAGTFSSTAGLIFISTATGQIDISASTPGTYIVTNIIAQAGNCNAVVATSPFTIVSTLSWTGTSSSDWNNAGNWSCGGVPGAGSSVTIPNVPNKPVLGLGLAATVNNLTISSGSSLTISGNTIRISGTITNGGTLTATNGTIEFNGSAPQVIGAGTFTGSIVKDLTVNNPTGVTLTAPLDVTGIVRLTTGNLSSNGNLTLLSTAAGTALIDGSGSGNITGNVTMQRYLPDGFGYKYFSSPFQAANVGELSDDMITLNAGTFYKYDENRTSSGWVSYGIAANPLVQVNGYAVNFGNSHNPRTVDITGQVNNGSISVTLQNHNYTYTKGFSLTGNPYPSPIDWDLVSPGNTNIDNAIYLFKASPADQYTGTYSSYVGGTGASTGGTNLDIIPSMQGFFVHVSNGPPYPVAGTLNMTNSVRIVNFSQPFAAKKGTESKSSVNLLKLSARYSDDLIYADPTVLYFNEKGTPEFDGQLDALKLLNTDLQTPNLYSVASDGSTMSINALPPITDFIQVPLGLKLNRTTGGTINFKLQETDPDLAGMRIYISDLTTGAEQDLLQDQIYTVNLPKGEYLNRFYLNISNITTSNQDIVDKPEIFRIYSSENFLKAEVNRLDGAEGIITIFNFSGQKLLIKKVYEPGFYEFETNLTDGIYLVNFKSGTFTTTRKLFIQNR